MPGTRALQVAVAHDTLLVHASTVSVQVTRSSKRVRLLVKQARQHWMERQVTEILVAAENGTLKPLCQKPQNESQSGYAALPAVWSCCDYPARGGLCVAASICQGFRPPSQNGPF